MSETTEVRKWYNDFSGKQMKTGINLRHYSVFNQVVASGLKKHHRILEIGCGIGTLTTLLGKYIRSGKIVATDISDESIRIASERFGKNNRVEFMVSDMQDFMYPGQFDFIILADVMEHIPIEDHGKLFGVLSAHMHEQSKLIVHIPHPKLIEHLQVTSPQALQVIDQAVHADVFCQNAYAHGLILDKYRAYRLFHCSPDYVYIQMKLNSSGAHVMRSKKDIITKKLRERVKFIWTLLRP